MSRVLFVADDSVDGLRLDKAIALLAPELSRSVAQNLLQSGAATVNDECVKKNSLTVNEGDRIALELPEPQPLEAQPQEIPLDIVYEDDWLLVVNKPKGMVVHPAPGNPDGTLVNALLWHCGGSLSGINGVIRPGIVHRIDKDTSGLLIVAKNDAAHIELSRQISEHSFTRRYEAIVHGHLKSDPLTVDAPIGRSKADRKKMCVTESNSRRAVTHYRTLEELSSFSHLECTLETGRTHQIRVHAAYIGHPVLGDTVYGPKPPALDTAGQCLHARTIGFVHPGSGEYMEFTADLPAYFLCALQKLR